MSRPRLGLIGLGRIADLHIKAHLTLDRADIVALCDTDRGALKRASGLAPNAECSQSLNDFIRIGLDLVEVLTPHPYHAEQAIAAMEAGAHVSVQKPFAISLDEAEHMIETADRTGKRLLCYENYLHFPPVIKARELIAEGRIGRPLHMRMRTLAGDPGKAWQVQAATWAWRASLFESHGLGRLTFDDGHHRLATAQELFGPVADVRAWIGQTQSPNGPVDAPSSIMWRHVDPPVHVIWDVIYAPKLPIRTDYYALDERFEITGETGILEITRATGRMRDTPVITLYADGRTTSFHDIEDDWGRSFIRATSAMLDCIIDGKPHLFEGRRARSVLALGLAISEAGRTGETVRIGDEGRA